MVEGVVGLMGSGKTLLATRVALDAVKNGVGVVANYRIEGCQYAQSWDEVMAAVYGFTSQRGDQRERLLVVIDELNLWAASRNWQKLDPRLLSMWAQGRKLGFDMVWTSQHESRVDTVVREITSHVWKARRYGPERYPLLFQYAAYLPADLRLTKRRCLKRRWVLPRKGLLNAFNTWEIIDVQGVAYDTSKGPSYRQTERPGPLPVTVEAPRRGVLRRRTQKVQVGS